MRSFADGMQTWGAQRDADFKEGEHPRNESGQWTAGGGAGGVKGIPAPVKSKSGEFDPVSGKNPPESTGGTGEHKRDTPAKRILESPHGLHYMEDADGNVWSHSEKRHGWVASASKIGGKDWQDVSEWQGHLKRMKRIIPQGPLPAKYK